MNYLVGEVYSHGKDADIIWWRKRHDEGNNTVSVEEISLGPPKGLAQKPMPRFTRAEIFSILPKN